MKAATPRHEPLNGVRIVEFEDIGPGPLAGWMLVGMGANVTVIARHQRGALAQAAGHDLNYVALTGLLSLSACLMSLDCVALPA